MEIATRGGLGAEDSFTPFDAVEVDLEDAPLAEQRLELPCEHKLLAFANKGALAAEKEILGELLGDRRPADDLGGARRRDGAAARSVLTGNAFVDPLGDDLGMLVAFPGLLQGVPFDAAVFDETGILGGDHRALEVRRDRPVVNPFLLPSRRVRRPGQPPCLGSLEGRRLRIDPDHRRDAQQKIHLQRQRSDRKQSQGAAERASPRGAHSSFAIALMLRRRAGAARPAHLASTAARRARRRRPPRLARRACPDRRDRGPHSPAPRR